jgi:DNA (cytosine-5)-methyltransferase 1
MNQHTQRIKTPTAPSATAPGARFVEVFAGCGGLSLGLKRSGWRGLFAIEKDRLAFETLRANFLVDSARYRYDWPAWLECRPWCVEDVLAKHGRELRKLRGTIDLLAGGPPCQGFSSAGLRRVSDPRNALMDRYLEVVELIQPRVVLLENVLGFTRDFNIRGEKTKNFSRRLQDSLSDKYDTYTDVLHAARFGVPQARRRFILIGVRRVSGQPPINSPFTEINKIRDAVLARHGLVKYPTARSALSDLTVKRNGKVPCPDSEGFEAIGYRGPLSAFQRSMREGSTEPPSDTRLARHTPETVDRFTQIIQLCRATNRSKERLSEEIKEQVGLRKGTLRVLVDCSISLST